MDYTITKNAPPLQGVSGRHAGSKRNELFTYLDRLEVMDLLTAKNRKPSTMRSMLSKYKKQHPGMNFKSRLDGKLIKIQRLADSQ